MTSEHGDNVSIQVAPDDRAFLESNSLNDLKELVQELSDLGEDTTDISGLIAELEDLYRRFDQLPLPIAA